MISQSRSLTKGRLAPNGDNRNSVVIRMTFNGDGGLGSTSREMGIEGDEVKKGSSCPSLEDTGVNADSLEALPIYADADKRPTTPPIVF